MSVELAHKKGFLVSLVQKQFCVFGDSFSFAYGCFRSWPLCCWEHMVFSSAWQNCSQQKLLLFGGAFLASFCTQKKRDRFPCLSFRFLSSCLSFFLSERVAHALLTGEGILLAHLPSTNVILERVSLCRPVAEKLFICLRR